MRAFPPPIAEPRCRVPQARYHDRRALGVGCRHRGYRDYARDPSVRVYMCAGLIVCLAINPAIAYIARGETSAVARAEREAKDSTPSTACHRRSTLRRRIHTPQGPPRPAVARRGSTRLVGGETRGFLGRGGCARHRASGRQGKGSPSLLGAEDIQDSGSLRSPSDPACAHRGTSRGDQVARSSVATPCSPLTPAGRSVSGASGASLGARGFHSLRSWATPA